MSSNNPEMAHDVPEGSRASTDATDQCFTDAETINEEAELAKKGSLPLFFVELSKR
jgi:hypothetical protein